MMFQDDDQTPQDDDQKQDAEGDEGVDNEDQSMASGGAQKGDDSAYLIPDDVQAQYPDLVDLIKKSESMNEDERNYWFQTLLIMNEEQVKNLHNILKTEKENLEEIDKQAQQEMNSLNEKQVQEWKQFEEKEKRKILREAEKKSQEDEIGEEEALLKELEDL